MSIDQILVIMHIIGTVIGVGGATMIELHLGQALKDKLVSADEKAILNIDYRVVRIGLMIILISGLGFLLLDKFEGYTKYLYSPRLWAKILMVVIIAGNTLLLQAHMISLYWGSAFSFVAWWMAALIGMFVTHNVQFDFFGTGEFLTTFASLMSIFAVGVVLGAILLHGIRNKMSSNV